MWVAMQEGGEENTGVLLKPEQGGSEGAGRVLAGEGGKGVRAGVDCG